MPLTPRARLAPYEIVAFIGAGGMGEVWRARGERLEREVALKVLPADTLTDETARARLLREPRMASKLNHSNICNIHEVGEAEGQTCVARELIEGQSLSALDRGYVQGGYPAAMRLAAQPLASRYRQTYVPTMWIAELHTKAGEKDLALE